MLEGLFIEVLLGATMSRSGRKLIEMTVGPDDKRALSKLCSIELAAALDEELKPFPTLPEERRTNLIERLESVLDFVAASSNDFGVVDAQDLTAALKKDPRMDLDTFGIFHGNEFYALDARKILRKFTADLPRRINEEARRSDSKIANLSAQLNFQSIRAHLGQLDGAVQHTTSLGTTKSVDEAWERARARQRGVIANRLTRDLARSVDIESEQVRLWRRWREVPSWRSNMGSALRKVGEALQARDVRMANEILQAADSLYGTYAEIISSFDGDLLERANAALTNPSNARQKDNLAGPLADLSWLEAQVKQPTFLHCFTMTGAFGSGKSHSLTRMAQEVEAAGDVVVFATGNDGSFKSSNVLNALSEALGRNFFDIQDLEELMALASGRSIYVVIEGLDRLVQGTQALEELLAQISASTRVSGLRWCISVDTHGYDAVLSSLQPDFWPTYGVAFEGGGNATGGQVIGGWLNLDEINSHMSLGLRLLEALSADDTEGVGTMFEHTSDFRSEHSAFTNPLPAWIRADTLGEEALREDHRWQGATNPQDPAFVAAYWRHLKRRQPPEVSSDQTKRENIRLEHAVDVLSGQLRDGGVPILTLFPVPPGTSEIDASIVRRIRRMGLLRETSPDEESEYADQAVATFAPFWGQRIGKSLAEKHARNGSRKADATVSRWFRGAILGDPLAVGVCQFFLGEVRTLMPDLATDVWTAWSRDRSAPKGPLLIAGSAAQSEYSQIVRRSLSWSKYNPINRRECFLFLRFICVASAPHWLAASRIRLMSRHWSTIGGYGLATYAEYAVQSILTTPGRLTKRNFAETCEAFLGCEEAGVADVAAHVLIGQGIELFGRDDLPAVVMETLKTFSWSKPPTKGGSRSKNQDGHENHRLDLYNPDEKSFTQRFVFELLTVLLKEPYEPSASMRTLAKLGFWNSQDVGVHSQLSRYMDHQMNLRYGFTAHRDGPGADYVLLVEDLIGGEILPNLSPKTRHTYALYVIKHSVPTRRRWDLQINEALHPSMQSLWRAGLLSERDLANLLILMKANHLVT